MENNKRFNVLAITFMILSLLVDGVLGYQLFCEHKKTEAIDFIGHNAQELYEWCGNLNSRYSCKITYEMTKEHAKDTVFYQLKYPWV